VLGNLKKGYLMIKHS